MQALLEVVVLEVADPDASLSFYRDLVGFDLDVDYAPSSTFRVVQLTPPGSSTSIQFGKGLHVPRASLRGLCLVVSDLVKSRQELRDRGVDVSEISHKDTDGGWQGGYLPGVDANRTDYASFAYFDDPDGNGWVLQERGHRPHRESITENP